MTAAFESLPPLIAAQLKYLLTHSSLPIKVGQIWSGCKNTQLSDRITLLIPFCLDYVKWDIIYNAYYPLVPPDVVFSAEDEDFHPLSVLEDEKEGEALKKDSSLYNWDSKDPSRLLALIHELRDLYKCHQRKLVGELDDARLKFEISTSLSREGIEVHKIMGNERTDEVKFAVPLLDMDLNKLVPGCPWKEQQWICLQVVFPVSRKYSAPTAPNIKLISSPDLRMLVSIEDVKLPPWLDGMCMAEYLPNLEEKLKEQVMEAVKAVAFRRRFIESLATVFGWPVEADPVFCRTATVLACSGVFTFLVHISIPTQFPKQQPTLTLESSFHFDFQGRPIKSAPIMEYPWSPRWEMSHMAERIFDFLVDECLGFKKYCGDVLTRQQ